MKIRPALVVTALCLLASTMTHPVAAALNRSEHVGSDLRFVQSSRNASSLYEVTSQQTLTVSTLSPLALAVADSQVAVPAGLWNTASTARCVVADTARVASFATRSGGRKVELAQSVAGVWQSGETLWSDSLNFPVSDLAMGCSSAITAVTGNVRFSERGGTSAYLFMRDTNGVSDYLIASSSTSELLNISAPAALGEILNIEIFYVGTDSENPSTLDIRDGKLGLVARFTHEIPVQTSQGVTTTLGQSLWSYTVDLASPQSAVGKSVSPLVTWSSDSEYAANSQLTPVSLWWSETGEVHGLFQRITNTVTPAIPVNADALTWIDNQWKQTATLEYFATNKFTVIDQVQAFVGQQPRHTVATSASGVAPVSLFARTVDADSKVGAVGITYSAAPVIRAVGTSTPAAGLHLTRVPTGYSASVADTRCTTSGDTQNCSQNFISWRQNSWFDQQVPAFSIPAGTATHVSFGRSGSQWLRAASVIRSDVPTTFTDVLSTNVPSDESELAAPTNLRSTVTGVQAEIAWNAVANATAYKVIVNGVVKCTTAAVVCSVTGLAPNSSNRVAVRAVAADSFWGAAAHLDVVTQKLVASVPKLATLKRGKSIMLPLKSAQNKVVTWTVAKTSAKVCKLTISKKKAVVSSYSLKGLTKGKCSLTATAAGSETVDALKKTLTLTIR